MGLDEIRAKFEKMMGDAWEKYDSSEYEGDLEEYGEDYEKAYDYLFGALEADYIPRSELTELWDKVLNITWSVVSVDKPKLSKRELAEMREKLVELNAALQQEAPNAQD